MTAIIQILISISINGDKTINFERNYFLLMYLLALIFKADITF